jgi:hypothetical protein
VSAANRYHIASPLALARNAKFKAIGYLGAGSAVPTGRTTTRRHVALPAGLVKGMHKTPVFTIVRRLASKLPPH